MRARLGRTGITVDKDGFGGLPMQRIAEVDAVALLHAARAAGLQLFDTARAYSDSEAKLGQAFAGRWHEVVLAGKSMANTGADLTAELDTSLGLLRCEAIDIFQFHNPSACPAPGDGTGLYEAAEAAKKAGKIRCIGITSHRLAVARKAVESGLYDALQFPFSYLASDEEIALVELCKKHDVGFIAMKALAGGLITDVAAARAWLARFENVVPIWGLQRPAELDALVAARGGSAELTAAQAEAIERDRAELAGSFCRGCGYCMPCPQNIEISMCARMFLLLRRAPRAGYLGEEWQQKMAAIEGCVHCGQCSARCPYGLDTPALLASNLADYKNVLNNSI